MAGREIFPPTVDHQLLNKFLYEKSQGTFGDFFFSFILDSRLVLKKDYLNIN